MPFQAQGGQAQATARAEAAQAAGQAAEARAAEAAQRAEEIARQIQERIAVAQVRPGRPGQVVIAGASSPSAVYEALKEQRDELTNQLRRLENQRENLAEELQNGGLPSAARTGLESRLTSVDARIAQVESQLAEADAAVARAAAVPGAVVPPPPRPRDPGPPEEFWVLSGLMIFFVFMPIAVAYARRIWKRGSAAVAAIPQEIYDRFNRLDQAIDSVAIEVERVGEGQRFLTRVYAEQRGLGAGPAERIEAERVAQKQHVK